LDGMLYPMGRDVPSRTIPVELNLPTTSGCTEASRPPISAAFLGRIQFVCPEPTGRPWTPPRIKSSLARMATRRFELSRNPQTSGSSPLSKRVAETAGLVLVVVSSLLALPALAQSPDDLRLRAGIVAGEAALDTPLNTAHRLRLERSQDLRTWTELAVVQEQLQAYRDRPPEASAPHFYRVEALPSDDTDDWSNQARPSSGALFKPGTGSGLAATAYVKWLFLLEDPQRVYFQDSVKYPYHIQFARARLPGYGAMGPLEFYAQSLYASEAQRMVVGSVLRAPDPQVRELAIEVTGAEAFPAAKVVDWIEAVRRRLVPEPGWRVFYMPSTEQRAETEAHRTLFEARGIEIASLERWATANACTSAGWALGRLVWVSSTEIHDALGDGRLQLGDILVTDRVPSELPVLAGYLCLEPATPNSHVALLARSLLLPFAYVNGEGLQAEIASLYGREVLLVVGETNGICQIDLQDTTGRLTPEQREEILASKKGGPLAITPKAAKGIFTLPVDDLTPADVRFVGGKAANLGFLRRSLPDFSPAPTIAVTFDLWDAYLAQPLGGGQSLVQFITSRLAPHTYPPNILTLRNDLAIIQEAITDDADFTPAQRAAILAALQNAGLGGAKIRFRSSTNVEDGESFSGAGLYDSYSGCLEDDIDADQDGPSRCDPDEAKERGVFRAMRKVYASFYNENAFLERLRHGVREDEVGMAILVHFSVPDEFEMANGVATLAVDKGNGGREVTARLVSQLGAVSVTNPDGSVRPEVVTASFTGTESLEAALTLDQTSTLTADGEPVMRWETDYRTLLARLNTATLAYESYYTPVTTFELDFEYKRVVPGEIHLKQIRAVPHPTPVPPPILP